MPKVLLIFLVSFFFAECLIEDPKNLILNVDGIKIEKIGKKGTIVISSDQEGTNYKIIDTNRETCINAKISDGNTEYPINCGLWCEDQDSSLYVFCSIGEDINPGRYSILFDQTKNYICSDYSVNLKPRREIRFTKLAQDIVDLYAKSQTITVENGIDSYELKFNIISYNKEKLFLGKLWIIDNCREENSFLICPITKNELEQIVQPSRLNIRVYYMDPDNKQELFPLVSEIKIAFKDLIKTDIYVRITKLLVTANEHDVPIAYETNVTDISEMKLFYEGFDLPFEKEGGGQGKEEGECNFVKYENTSLLLVCWVNGGNKFWLKEITNETIINDTNVKYNFRIQPVYLPDKIEYGENAKGSFIDWYYPKILNFTENDGPLYIDYSIENPDSLNGLTLNEKESDLECERLKGHIKRCKVPKSHFRGKTSGFYFTQHIDHLGKKTISYEVPPVQVIGEFEPESSNGNTISLLLIYFILFGIIMI